MRIARNFLFFHWFITTCTAFVPCKSTSKATFYLLVTPNESNEAVVPTKPVEDPQELYPETAPERKESTVQPKKSSAVGRSAVEDPQGIYRSETAHDGSAMSASLPFLKRPLMLDGTLPGDRGFDPFNFAYDADTLQWYRTAEVKHARLAMLAAVGWPIFELLNFKLAFLQDLKPLLLHQDSGLDRANSVFLDTAISAIFVTESLGFLKEKSAETVGAQYTPGDLGFDPFRLAKGNSMKERLYKAEAELFNGRLAMLAVAGYAAKEWWIQNSVLSS
jgi:Chlorophyll A-B binding protein